MNDPRHNEQLLADVLGEGASDGFRQVLLKQTLGLARRRRRFRQMRRGASALAVLAVLGLLVWHQVPSSRRPEGAPAKPYTLVRTEPLPAAAWLTTKPLSPTCVVASARTENVIITAAAAAPLRAIDDDELLALVGKPAALVRRGPHAADLVFVNKEDRDELLRN